MDENGHKELDDLRKEIDKVDLRFLEELAEFMRERMKIVEKVGAYKRWVGSKISDSVREHEVIRDRSTRGKNKGLSVEMDGKIFQSIVDHSRQHE